MPRASGGLGGLWGPLGGLWGAIWGPLGAPGGPLGPPWALGPGGRDSGRRDLYPLQDLYPLHGLYPLQDFCTCDVWEHNL